MVQITTVKGKTGTVYAVCLRREKQLFLLLRIIRAPKGDIYVRYPDPGTKEWAPHTSYHKDGRFHHKDFDAESMGRQLARPDSQFRGTQNPVTLAVGPNQWRNITSGCQQSKFDQVFEVPHAELPLETSWTHLSIDIIDASEKPVLIPGARILRQGFFKDARPWIALTLFLDSNDLAK
jgi:hypothetical protein